MKKALLFLFLILTLCFNGAYAGTLNSYPVNSSPAIEDRMLGIDDPTGTWSTKLYGLGSIFGLFQSQDYYFTGNVDLTGATSVSSGPLVFTPTGTLPDLLDGRLFYYNGLGYRAFGFFNLTSPRYFLDYGAAPTTDGQVLVWRSRSGFVWEAQNGGAAINDSTTATTSVWSSSKTASEIANVSAAAGLTTFPAYKDSAGTKGQYAVNDAGTLLAMCVDANSWRTVALSDTLSFTPTTPTLVSLTIPTSGDTATAVFSEAVSYGAGGAGGWTLNSPTNAMTYASGTGTDTIVFNLASTILSTDTPTVSYTQPTNGFESADDGVDLASITNVSVTNNSTQTAENYTDIIFWSGFEGTGSPSYTGTTGDYPENVTATATSLAVVSETAKNIGAKGLYIQSSSDYFTFSAPSGASFNAQRHGFWVNMPTWTSGTYFYVDQYDSSNFLRVSAAAGGEILVDLRNAGTYVVSATTTGLSLSSNTWYYIEVVMNQTGGGLTLKVNGSNTSIMNDAYTSFAVAPTSKICGNTSSTTGITYIDNVSTSSDISRDLYLLRNNTESPR